MTKLDAVSVARFLVELTRCTALAGNNYYRSAHTRGRLEASRRSSIGCRLTLLGLEAISHSSKDVPSHPWKIGCTSNAVVTVLGAVP
jgi:hypothetical protein